jgi:hypothetical protein
MSLTELHLLDGETADVKDPDRVWAWPARILLLLILALAAFFGIRAFLLPLPLGAIAPPAEFSATRALRHVDVVAHAPSGGVEAVLAAEAAALGLSSEILPGGSRGVVARLAGSQPSGAILLVSSYDPAGSAAGTAGAATILETLRALLTGPRPRNDVLVLLSATRPLDEAAIAARGATLVLRFERLSDRGPVALLATSPGSGGLVRETLRRVPHPTAFLAWNDAAGLPTLPATLSFVAVGGPAAAGGLPDPRTLQDAGETALALVRSFGGVALPVPSGPGLVAFNVGQDQVVTYPAAWSRTGGIVAAVLAALLLALGFLRRKLAPVPFTTAVLLVPAAVAVAAAVAAGALGLLVRWNPGGHALPWGTAHSAWFSGGLLAFAAAVVAALDVLLRSRRRTPRADASLAAAGLTWAALLALVAGLRHPDAAYLAVVPAVLFVPAFLVLFLTDDVSRHPWMQATALAVAAAPAVLLLAPVWRLLDVVSGWVAPAPRLSLAAVSAGLGAFIAALLLPHLSLPRRRWLFPAFCLVVGASLLVLGARLTP